MHGGGDGTLTREGAINTVHRYLPDLVKLADELNFILVVPSTNGLNWGGHTHGMLRDLVKMVRSELNVDANNIGLAGHSMGGMGITRNAHWLTDQFSFFLALAAGMDQKGSREENLIHNFNTVYEHQQGLQDSFQVFIERCQFQETVMKEIELKYSRSSGFKMKYYDGPHKYDYKLVYDALKEHFISTRRNIYQPNLFGSMYFKNGFYTENNIQYHANEVNTYFWVEVMKADELAYPFRVNLRTNIDSSKNEIQIDFDENLKFLKQLRIFVSRKNLDFNNKIKVVINGKLLHNKRLKISNLTNTYIGTIKYLKKDPAFDFDGNIDINLDKQPSVDKKHPVLFLNN